MDNVFRLAALGSALQEERAVLERAEYDLAAAQRAFAESAQPERNADDLRMARRDLEEHMGTVVEPIDPTRGASLTDRIQATPELMATLSPLVGMLLRTRREAVTV